MYALVDCNSFYASCEKVFLPNLWNKPVVVLSNNDGNVVALSMEAKKLNIPFGAPFFEWKEFMEKNSVAVFSSNYTLYGDMSRRVMDTLEEFTPELEIYSIDEAFLSFHGMQGDVTRYSEEIRVAVKQRLGIPVSVGIGSTKTLAKLANKIAKKRSVGVFNFSDCYDMDTVLDSIGVRKVWGVGSRYEKMLNDNGIHSVRQLRDAPDKWIRKRMTVVGLRMVMELRGIPCLSLDELPSAKKEIVSSRSFGKPVEKFDELREALSSYVSRAAEKLRSQYGLASEMTVFLTTNRFKEQEPQYSKGIIYKFPSPISYTPFFIHCAGRLLSDIYRSGYRYKKVGVMLSGIIPEGNAQLSLFTRFQDTERTRRLMDAMDRVNREMGGGVLYFASTGIQKPWRMRRFFLSPCYTTKWSDIPVVRA